MQNFEIENKLLSQKNKNEIKKLWRDNFFEDSAETVNSFLENVFENKKGVGAFLNNELVSMVLFLNSKIIFKNKKIKSIYFYAVCTEKKYRNNGIMRKLFSFAFDEARKQGYEICFLVPETEELFKMYEKFSFKRSICYEEKCIYNSNNKNTVTEKTDFCYNDYKQIKLTSPNNRPLIVWGKDEFEFIFNKKREDVEFIFTSSSFAVYEINDTEILVYEICGDEEEILNLLFNKHSDCKKIILRVQAEKSKKDFGMTLSLTDTQTEIEAIYFGMPYA